MDCRHRTGYSNGFALAFGCTIKDVLIDDTELANKLPTKHGCMILDKRRLLREFWLHGKLGLLRGAVAETIGRTGERAVMISTTTNLRSDLSTI